ncbi:MAG: DUF624 domain-containing protein [Oscillospiraceae bacterium]|nr:DUF624 domain-containing protein [Oscillospiraceae bacterium]MCL2278655.1 DUF624 domain-containing protein [Oscillospiraceae bacterium]
MPFFSRNFNKPGPGVEKDEPRKKGAARFVELLARDMWELMKLNILFSLTALPSVVAFFIGFTMGFGLMLILAVVLAFPIGGGLTACVYYITKLMRDDPSFVWYEYRRKFKENFRQAAPAGIICTVFVYAHIWIWVGSLEAMLAGEPIGDIMGIIFALFSLLIFSLITPYIFLHFAYIDLKSLQTVKNSVLMAFGYFPRSFMGALLGGLIWMAFALFMPLSFVAFPLIPLIAFSLSMLLNMMWVWPPFDKHFSIEETLVKRIDEEIEE